MSGDENLRDRLDENKIDQLRRWGAGLANAESDELRATGKAILLLIEEIEALHVDLWHAKAVSSTVVAVDEPEELHRSLAERLRLSRRGAV